MAREFNKPDYTYRVTLVRVIDGDTIDVMVDLGMYQYVRKRLRFINLDTEELRDRDAIRREGARKATERLTEILSSADTIYIQTVMDSTGKYGRLLANVWVENEGVVTDVNNQMIVEGFQKAPE